MLFRRTQDGLMRQTHSLIHPKHKPPQALAAVKNKIRKYIKRERRKQLPEGVDFWDFDCKVGLDAESATEAHIATVIKRIDELSEQGATAVYVEIFAKAGHRTKKPQ